jgi:Subtilase family
MTARIRQTATLGLVALAAGSILLALLAARAVAMSTVSPLPASDYSVQQVCPPPAPRHAACMALRLVPRTTEARAHTHPLGTSRLAPLGSGPASAGLFGITPAELHTAYQLPNTGPAGQTIALIDAYNDPTAEADLKAYREELLPAETECTTGNGCFEQVNQKGESGELPFPKTLGERKTSEAKCEAEGTEEACAQIEEANRWAGEISLDIESVHAACENCHILLVEANSSSYEDLEAAEQTAVALGATEISNSWGGEEPSPPDNAFNHPGTVITASAGDAGYLDWAAKEAGQRTKPESGTPNFPASSPHVVAVGGTRLSLGAGGAWQGETVWNGNGATGSGCSAFFEAQPWQLAESDWSQVGCSGNHRAVADVSADADPHSGLAVYQESPGCESEYEQSGVKHTVHWCTIGGTSLASPIVASVFALAGGAHGVSYPARSLYKNEAKLPESLHDITAGSNDGSNGVCTKALLSEERSGCTTAEEKLSCSSSFICLAASGYDGPTGVGTPHGIAAFQPPVGEVEGEEGGEKTGSPGEGEEEGAPPGGGEKTGSSGGGKSSSGGVPLTPGGWNGFSAGVLGAFRPSSTSTSASGAANLRLSGLSLTHSAIVALNHLRPRLSKVGFAFNLSAAAPVHIVLAKRIRVHRHTRWQTQSSLTILAAAGRGGHRLSGRRVLAAGLYRLALVPAHGIGQSILFHIG